MKLNFQQEVLALPGAVLTHCGEADAPTLRILLWLASDLSLAEKPRQLAKLAECDVKAVKAALQFWQFRDVVSAEEKAVPAMAHAADVTVVPSGAGDSNEKTESVPSDKKRTLLRRADELPNYTSEELASLMEERASVRMLIDEAQRILGKMLNPSDLNVLVGMLDYLGMSEECVLLLLAHCKRISKTNLRAIEKYAYSFADKEITTAEAMETEIRKLEALKSFEGEMRTLFGMSNRALTTKESKLFSAWVSFGYDLEIVRMAYELTVNATNEPSVPYTNAILERWHAEGLKTVEQIQAYLEAKSNQRKGTASAASAPVLGNSFDTDDFFEAALRRGFQARREN